MYREYNGQWRQLDAVKIFTENTMVNEGNQRLYKICTENTIVNVGN